MRRPWFQGGMLTMLTLRPGRAEGQMWNQRSHTVSMFDKDEEMLKKWRRAVIPGWVNAGDGFAVLMPPTRS